MSDAAAATTEVWATTPTESGTLWEALNATMVAEDSAPIWAVSMVLSGLHYGDKVTVTASAEAPRVATTILEWGGYATFRVWLGEEEVGMTWRSVADTYAQRGRVVDVWSERLLALSCVEHLARDVESHLSRDGATQSFLGESGARIVG